MLPDGQLGERSVLEDRAAMGWVVADQANALRAAIACNIRKIRKLISMGWPWPSICCTQRKQDCRHPELEEP